MANQDGWEPVPQGDQGWEPVPQDKTSQATQSPIPDKPIGQRIVEGVKDAGNVMLQGIAGAPAEGTLNAIAGGAQNNIAQAIKRFALDRAIPSNDVVSSAAKTALLEGTNPVNIFAAMIPGSKVLNLEGNKALTEVAKDSQKALQAAEDAFSNEYNAIFDKVGAKVINSTGKESLTLAAADAIEQTAPDSVANKFLETKLPKLLDDNITVKELHAAKAHIFELAKGSIGVEKNALMKVYNQINSVLSTPEAAGEQYANLTSQYHDYLTNESNYVKRLILDPVNKNNVTIKKLNPSLGATGIRTPIKLQEGYKTAFEKLSARPTTKVNILKNLEAIRRGTILKRAVLAGAGALANPDIRKAIIEASKVVS